MEDADLMRTSYQSLSVIPNEHKFTMHRMYEDNDLDGAEEAEAIISFIEKEQPGSFVGILANDSVSPSCVSGGGVEHYNCDYYAPYWYTVLISAQIWEKYTTQVEEADLKWKKKHGCKLTRVK